MAGETVVFIYAYFHTTGIEKLGFHVNLILWQQDKKKKECITWLCAGADAGA